MKITKSYKIPAIMCVTAGFAMAVACSDAKGGNKTDGSTDTQRPDNALAELMQSISDGNANVFASICTYPIDRPYPLRSIEDSATMVDYFPLLVDAKLREEVRQSKLDDWENYGWRGWSLGDSTILWYDDGLNFIDYESPAERGLRKILAREEIMSLMPELRGDWTPIETIVEIDGNRIFRIDADRNGYRLMEYDKPENMRSKPVLILRGTADSEGSAGFVTYSFTDSIGNTAEYSPDMEQPVKIYISSPGKKTPREYIVRRGYWRDYLK